LAALYDYEPFLKEAYRIEVKGKKVKVSHGHNYLRILALASQYYSSNEEKAALRECIAILLLLLQLMVAIV
jgi:hypothetical protein